MKIITSEQLHHRTQEIQKLAHIEPVLIANGDERQVLMDYDEYAKLAGFTPDKPFVSLGEIFMNLPPEVASALAQVKDDDSEEPVTLSNTAVSG